MRKTLSQVLLAVILLGAGFHIAAAWAQSQTEMNRQASESFKKAEAKLNVVYKQIMALVSGAQRTKFVNAELAWLKYRDANCEAEAYGNLGGSIYSMVYNNCAEHMTAARMAELQAVLSEMKSH